MAGVALGDIHLRFEWQAWRLVTSTFVFRGRRGTYGTARVALGDKAWHLVTSSSTLRGRRGAWRHPPSFCVAGVALGDIHLRFAWQAWHWATSTFVLRGRRDTYGTGLALVARLGWDWSPVTPRHFAWQAWHLVTSSGTLRGRRGTWRHPPKQ